MELIELDEQRLHGVQGRTIRHGHVVQEGPGDGSQGQDRPPLEGEEVLEPPTAHIRKGEEPQRLSGRGAIYDHHFEAFVADVLVDPQEAGPLIHPGDDAHLLAEDIAHPSPGEQGRHVALQVPPVLVYRIVDVDFLAPQPVGDGGRLGTELGVEGVGQAVGRIRA